MQMLSYDLDGLVGSDVRPLVASAADSSVAIDITSNHVNLFFKAEENFT